MIAFDGQNSDMLKLFPVSSLPLLLNPISWTECIAVENQHGFAGDKLILYSYSSDPRYLEIVPAVWRAVSIQSISSLIYKIYLILLY